MPFRGLCSPLSSSELPKVNPKPDNHIGRRNLFPLRFSIGGLFLSPEVIPIALPEVVRELEDPDIVVFRRSNHQFEVLGSELVYVLDEK